VYGGLLRGPDDQPPGVYASSVEEDISKGVDAYLHTLKSLNVPPPFAVFLSLQGVRGGLIIGHAYGRRAEMPLRVDDLLFPEIIIDDYGSSSDYQQKLKPVFDTVWNAAGLENSPSYSGAP